MEAPGDAADHPGMCRVTTPDGTHIEVPAFLGADGWRHARVRHTGPGAYEFAFEGTTTTVEVTTDAPPRNDLEVRSGERFLRRGGEPFLWVADTWWYAFSDRADDESFAELVKTRTEQGFNTVQLVAGLFPETTTFTEQASTNGRWSWTPDLAAPDPLWWDSAEERLATIVAAGLVPAVVGAWSYYLLDFGDERIRRHWHEVIARWAALPVVWCVCGEVGLPHYRELTEPGLDDKVADLVTRWTAIGDGVRALDPYPRPLTYHPCPAFRHATTLDAVGDRTGADFVWMQTGHADRGSMSNSLDALARSRAADPPLPVINSEVCYEGIAAGSPASLQRALFWTHVLGGAAGHTYGAQGIWAFARGNPEDPGDVWGTTEWRDAARLPGAEQTGIGGRLLAALDWTAFRPYPEGISPSATIDHPFLLHCAGTADQRVVYVPANSMREPTIGISLEMRRLTLAELAAGRWKVDVVNPRTGAVHTTHVAEVGPDGTWELPGRHFATSLPTFEDWLLICHKENRA